MTDSLVIQRSNQTFTQARSVVQDVFEHRLPDNNFGRYAGDEVKFNNINGVSTYENPLQISESDIIIPYMVLLESDATLGDIELVKQAVSLKGNLSIVSGSKYILDNNTLVDYTDNSEILNNFTLLNTMSEQDVITKGPGLNFKKDTNGFEYDDVLGETNNYRRTATGTVVGNKGAYNRMLQNANVEVSAGNSFRTNKHYIQNEVSHVEKVTGTNNYIFHFYVRIPLKHLNELYSKMPLLRGAVQEMYLQIHTATTNISYDSDGNADTFTVSTTHGSTPYMIADGAWFLKVNAPASGSTPATYHPAVLKISSGIAKVIAQNGTTYSHHKTNCELIAKMYKLDPELEKGFFNNPVQTIPYKKHLVARKIGIKAGDSFNFEVTGNIHKMRDLLVLPIISSTVNGLASTSLNSPTPSKVTFSPLESPHTSCGATCGPYAAITDYQLLISHQPYYKQPKKLSRDMFDEIKRLGMSGGMDMGFSNQLLSQKDYDTTHGFLYTDLTRTNSEIEYISTRSLTIQGKNNTPYTMDLICYLGYGARISIDTSISKIVIESPQDKDELDEANHQAMIKAL